MDAPNKSNIDYRVSKKQVEMETAIGVSKPPRI